MCHHRDRAHRDWEELVAEALRTVEEAEEEGADEGTDPPEVDISKPGIEEPELEGKPDIDQPDL